jgi:hypothetical protein
MSYPRGPFKPPTRCPCRSGLTHQTPGGLYKFGFVSPFSLRKVSTLLHAPSVLLLGQDAFQFIRIKDPHNLANPSALVDGLVRGQKDIGIQIIRMTQVKVVVRVNVTVQPLAENGFVDLVEIVPTVSELDIEGFAYFYDLMELITPMLLKA